MLNTSIPENSVSLRVVLTTGGGQSVSSTVTVLPGKG